jgi:hypothetical protein
MAEQAFLELAAEEQKEIRQTVSPQLARSASVLETDIWVCWALQALFSMPGAHPMAFKGGASLSKVVVAPHLKNELAKLPTADQHIVEVDGGGEKI